MLAHLSPYPDQDMVRHLGGDSLALAHLTPHPGFGMALAKRVTPQRNSFRFHLHIRVAGFFTLARQAYHNVPPLPGLGTGYVEAT
jgi:hypothetical protein